MKMKAKANPELVTFETISLKIGQLIDPISEDYLSAQKIQEWLIETRPSLSSLSGIQLSHVFSWLKQLMVVDSKFNLALIKATTEEKVKELDFESLLTMFEDFKQTTREEESSLAERLVKELINHVEFYEPHSLADRIWTLSKLNIREQKFFERWLPEALRCIDFWGAEELTKSIQAIASLSFFDESFISAWLGKVASTSINDRALVNNAFYLTLMSVNNDLTPSIKEHIDNSINFLVQKVNFKKLNGDDIAKQQLIQIKISGIYKEELKTQINLDTKGITTSSKIQKTVEFFIKKTYPKAIVNSEEYLDRTRSFIDIEFSILGQMFHAEIDGPTHYYRDGSINAFTIFRNKMHQLHYPEITHICASYKDIVDNIYQGKLLESINEALQPISSSESVFIKKQQSIAKAAAGAEVVAGTKAKAKKKPTAPKEDSFDSILAELSNPEEREYNQICEQYRTKTKSSRTKAKSSKKSGSAASPEDDILFNILEAQDFHSLKKVFMYKHKSEGEFISWLFQTAENLQTKLFQYLSPNREESKKYIQAYLKFYDLLTEYGYKLETTKYFHVIALTYSFGYGDNDMFQGYLDLFPESDNKRELMEFFFINAGILNYIDIAQSLLNQGVDINIYHARETLEIIFAAAIGHKHHDLEEVYDIPLYTELNDALKSERSSGRDSIHSICLSHAPGTKDAGTGKGVTALHLSCYRDNFKTVQWLLEQGASPNTLNSDNNTPLMTAMIKGLEGVALEILKYDGININLRYPGGATILHIAVYLEASKDLIQTIVNKKDIDLNAMISKDITFYTQIAKASEKIPMVFLRDQTVLYIALTKGSIETAKLLIEADRIDFNIPTNFQTILYSLLIYPELIPLLLDHGLDLNGYKNDTGISLLMTVAELSRQGYHYEIGRAYPDWYNKEHSRGIGVFEAHKKYQSLFLELITRGADVDFKDKDGDLVDKYLESIGQSSTNIEGLEAVRKQRDLNSKAHDSLPAADSMAVTSAEEADDFTIALAAIGSDDDDSLDQDTSSVMLDVYINGDGIPFMGIDHFIYQTPLLKLFHIIIPSITFQSSTKTIEDNNFVKQDVDSSFVFNDIYFTLSSGIQATNGLFNLHNLYHEPNLNNVYLLSSQILRLFSATLGTNKYLLAMNGMDIAKDISQGHYQMAATQFLITATNAMLANIIAQKEVIGVALGVASLGIQVSKLLDNINDDYHQTSIGKFNSKMAYSELYKAMGMNEAAKAFAIEAIEISAAHHEIYQSHTAKILDLATNFDLLGKICELKIDIDYC